MSKHDAEMTPDFFFKDEDIVVTLRESADLIDKTGDRFPNWHLRKAADEIERLRAENAKWQEKALMSEKDKP